LARAAASIIKHTASLVSGSAGFSGGFSDGLSAAFSEGLSGGGLSWELAGSSTPGFAAGEPSFVGATSCAVTLAIKASNVTQARNQTGPLNRRMAINPSIAVQPLTQTILDTGLALFSYRSMMAP